MAGTQRYWDGANWSDHIAPMAPKAPKAGQQSQLVSASLITGTGTLWTGVAIACGASIATWVLRKTVPTWVRVVAVLAAVVGIVNVVSVENQLDEKRQEITNLLG